MEIPPQKLLWKAHYFKSEADVSTKESQLSNMAIGGVEDSEDKSTEFDFSEVEGVD